jgi:alanyl-tRNA synthetase
MRNHTATHLLHAELRQVLGEHARQAGSLVAPDRLRFDFTHPEALTSDQWARIEAGINRSILGDYSLKITHKPLQQAISEGAMALFGEKYAETVRTISIRNQETAEPEVYSYELCGGTHVDSTSDIGLCLITSEGSVASGIRRIEAVTGRGAYELVQHRTRLLADTAALLGSYTEDVPLKVKASLEEIAAARKQTASLRQRLTLMEFSQRLSELQIVSGVPVLAVQVEDADADTLRLLADQFRSQYPSSVAVLASTLDNRPILIAAVTEDLVRRGLHAGDLVKHVAVPLGGGGGGRPTLAQAGGKDPARLPEALNSVSGWVQSRLTR